MSTGVFKSVLRSRNYLFSAPVPTLTIISASVSDPDPGGKKA